MTDPRNAAFSAGLLADVAVAQDINPDDPTATDGLFHLVHRQAFGVKGTPGMRATS